MTSLLLILLLALSQGQAEKAYLTARTPVDVGYKDVEGITAIIKPSVDLKGKIVVDAAGTSLKIQPEKLRLTLRSMETLPSLVGPPTVSQVVDPAGTFAFQGLPESTYQLTTVSGLPQEAYAAEVRQGARNVLEDPISITTDTPEPLQLTIRFGAGRVDGTVQDAEQKPVVRSMEFR